MMSANTVGEMAVVDLIQRCQKTSICKKMESMQNAIKLGKLI